MKVDIDWDRCEGHGLCAGQAPEVFDLDDDGELHFSYPEGEIPDALVPTTRSAIGACPVAALREVHC